MKFVDKYPDLFNFFAGYFPDADFDKLTDEEVVAGYRTDCSNADIEQTVKELNLLLTDPEYWHYAAAEANRYLPTSQDVINWLTMVRKELLK